MAKLRFVRPDSISQTGPRGIAGGAARVIGALILLAPGAVPQLVPDSLIRAILAEVSAENALRETAAIAARSRYPNSQSFFDAAEAVAERARAYGLRNVRIERFPRPGPMWDALEGELEITAPAPPRMISTLDREPLLVAQDSADGDVTAELVEAAGDVRGKVVITDKSPSAAWRELKSKGAAAVISAFRPAYFGRRPALDAVAWEQAPADALALMVSPQQGAELRTLIRAGTVTVRVHVRARRTAPGQIGQVMGDIPGELPGRDVVLAAHLDHQKPGANDNASGSGTLLEVARALQQLLAKGEVAKPRRTLRFWWSTEILSEQAYFRAHPEEAKSILLAVVLDQAGGDKHAENNFISIYGPEWLPSYADDLIHDLGEYVKEEFAPAEHEPSPQFVAPGGSSQSMRTVYWEYMPLSDHIAFEARDVRIPAIALAVPSLHVIHTNQDTVDRLDPTWMKRSALMTLAPALYIASSGPEQAREIAEVVFRQAAGRIAAAENPKSQLDTERKRLDSLHGLDASLSLESYRERLAVIAKAAGQAR